MIGAAVQEYRSTAVVTRERGCFYADQRWGQVLGRKTYEKEERGESYGECP